VYGLREVTAGGSRETDKPNPVGEYAMSCLGRERMFEHFSSALGIPVVLLRLNYACDLRYGVLVDIAERIWRDQPVDLAMSWFNTLWQADANAYTLLSLELATSPASHLNMTGAATLNVRDVALKLAEKLGKQVRFTGEETTSALLNDATHSFDLYGKPSVNEDELIGMVAAWIRRGGGTLGKPTHFESRDGEF
jgi:nucleoside-diphosphate-sugar epimerase